MLRLGKTTGVLTGIAATLIAGPVLASTTVLSADLVATGTPGGSATFRVEADAALGDFCYVLGFKGLGKVKDAVILPLGAAPGAKPLVTLELTGIETDMCIAVEPKVLEPIVAEPSKYVVLVRSEAAPQGAVQGALSKP